jgi:hypothetical protein
VTTTAPVDRQVPAFPEEPEALLALVQRELRGRPTSARLDAVLCLLEAARRLLPATDPERGDLTGEDVDDLRAAMRAASLSVRSYLWRSAGGDPADHD